MSIQTSSEQGSPGEPRSRPWTRSEYYLAGESGVFRPDERLELIDGDVFRKLSPVGSPHRFCVYQTRKALERIFNDGFYVDSEAPVTISEVSEPEPDVIVAKGEAHDYQDRHPYPNDICLLVEVSDSTLRYDRVTKSRVYAQARINENWIVNLESRCLEVHRTPTQESE